MLKWLFNWPDKESSINLFGGRVAILPNIGAGQAKGCWLRVQVRYMAFFFRCKNRKRFGMQVGIFAPRHNPETGYSCTKFFFNKGGVSA